MIVVFYFIIKRMLIIFFHKLNLSQLIIKYPLTESDKSLLDIYSTSFEKFKNGIVFYTDTLWSSKNNNYIFDIINNKYFIIDKGYYYYLDNLLNYKITFVGNNLKVFNNLKKINLI